MMKSRTIQRKWVVLGFIGMLVVRQPGLCPTDRPDPDGGCPCPDRRAEKHPQEA
ncbi:hypothetical protein NXW94_08330 [Bacteroides ovatus]|nr:hypothetical protein [Bacteroides ovatus]